MNQMDKPKIKRLAPQLASQIAAGEVVERPASVVKECLENSLDAGATRIEVDIEKGGKQLIRIRDNGCGISKDELPLALAQHATSKIATLDDLAKITSLGFRGEALASISSISRFALTSATQADGQETNTAWRVQVEGQNSQAKLTPAAHPPGTTIEVHDLFFNTPARRKFLRTDKTELSHIEEIIKRLALSRFDLDLCLRHHNKIVYQFKAAATEIAREQRIAKIFGGGFLKQALALDMSIEGLRLWGWISLPEFSRSQTDLQYFYVNGRIIRDRLINHAIRQAYADVIHPGRQPLFALYLEIDPSNVDVNVHPTKHEVRFRESRLVHDFIVKSLQDALACENSVQPKINMPETDLSFQKNQGIQGKKVEPQKSIRVTKPTKANQVQETLASYQALSQTTLGRVIGHAHQQHLLIEHIDGLLSIDLMIAQQKLLFAKLQQALQTNALHTQPLLMPTTVTLAASHISIIDAACDHLAKVGFELTRSDENAVLVRSIPKLLRDTQITHIIQAIFAKLYEHRDELTTFDLEALLIVISQAAVDNKINDVSLAKLEQLLTQLEATFSVQAIMQMATLIPLAAK